jgi:IS5 family transposase
MKVRIGVHKGTGLIHSVETTAANVHDITQSENPLYGHEKVVYADPACRWIEKREEMADESIEFRVAMRPGKCSALPDTNEGRLQDLVAADKAHICAKVEHPFWVI